MSFGTYGGIKARVASVLGAFFNLFPLGGVTPGVNIHGQVRLDSLPVDLANYVKATVSGNTLLTLDAINASGNFNLFLLSNGSQNYSLLVAVAGSNRVETRFPSSGVVSWSSNINPNAAGGDVSIYRIVAGVLGVGSGLASGASWLQNTAGESCLSSAFTESAGTLTSTNLSITVKAGRSYRIEGILQVSNTVTTEGVQIDFNGGTATATTFFVAAQAVGSVTAGTLTSTTLASVLNYTVITGTDYIYIRGFLKCNAGGTLILRAGENSHVTGILTVGAGSWLALSDTVPL